MRKRRAWRPIAAVVAVACALALLVPLPAFAATSRYVSLGDSIAVGLSAAPGQSYYDLYSAHLAPAYSSVNLAVEGKDSSDLLQDLTTPGSDTRRALAGAKVVTVCIGSNNLLGPVLAAVYEATGISTQGKTTAEVESELAAFINGHPDEWQAIVAQLTQEAQPGGTLDAQLQAGVRRFLADWPRISAALRALAPSARIYVLSIYDPMRGSAKLRAAFDALILPMNAAIRVTPLRYPNVRVVPADVLFVTHPGAISFDLAAVPASPASIDPHPTTYGHQLIYRTLVLDDALRRSR